MAISGLCTGTLQSSKLACLQLWNSGWAMDAKDHNRSAISTKWIFQQSCHLRVSWDAVVPSLSYMLSASLLPLLPLLPLFVSLLFVIQIWSLGVWYHTAASCGRMNLLQTSCARAPKKLKIPKNPSKLLTCLSSSRLDRGQKQLQNSKQ